MPFNRGRLGQQRQRSLSPEESIRQIVEDSGYFQSRRPTGFYGRRETQSEINSRLQPIITNIGQTLAQRGYYRSQINNALRNQYTTTLINSILQAFDSNGGSQYGPNEPRPINPASTQPRTTTTFPFSIDPRPTYLPINPALSLTRTTTTSSSSIQPRPIPPASNQLSPENMEENRQMVEMGQGVSRALQGFREQQAERRAARALGQAPPEATPQAPSQAPPQAPPQARSRTLNTSSSSTRQNQEITLHIPQLDQRRTYDFRISPDRDLRYLTDLMNSNTELIQGSGRPGGLSLDSIRFITESKRILDPRLTLRQNGITTDSNLYFYEIANRPDNQLPLSTLEMMLQDPTVTVGVILQFDSGLYSVGIDISSILSRLSSNLGWRREIVAREIARYNYIESWFNTIHPTLVINNFPYRINMPNVNNIVARVQIIPVPDQQNLYRINNQTYTEAQLYTDDAINPLTENELIEYINRHSDFYRSPETQEAQEIQSSITNAIVSSPVNEELPSTELLQSVSLPPIPPRNELPTVDIDRSQRNVVTQEEFTNNEVVALVHFFGGNPPEIYKIESLIGILQTDPRRRSPISRQTIPLTAGHGYVDYAIARISQTNNTTTQQTPTVVTSPLVNSENNNFNIRNYELGGRFAHLLVNAPESRPSSSQSTNTSSSTFSIPPRNRLQSRNIPARSTDATTLEDIENGNVVVNLTAPGARELSNIYSGEPDSDGTISILEWLRRNPTSPITRRRVTPSNVQYYIASIQAPTPPAPTPAPAPSQPVNEAEVKRQQMREARLKRFATPRSERRGGKRKTRTKSLKRRNRTNKRK